MMRKAFAATAIVLSTASLCAAEPNRPLLTRENRFPELHKAEVGAYFRHLELETRDFNTITPYARVGIFENVTAFAGVPYAENDPMGADAESGIGDVKLGLDLLAYEDVFEYPYVIPHLEVSLDTGDEDKGLGTGENIWSFGVSVGTVVYDKLHYIGDITYYAKGGVDGIGRDDEDMMAYSATIMWDISDRFSVLAEGRVLDQKTQEDYPWLLQGGMVYDLTERLEISVYGGSWHNTDGDAVATAKIAYTF